MKTLALLSTLLLFTTPQLHASSLLECRNAAGEVVLRLRAEKKTIRGAPSFERGGWWMEYQSKMYPGPIGEIVGADAKVEAEPASKSEVDIVIQHALTPTGPVGVRLKLRELETDAPHLVVAIFGGFVGRLEMAPLRCVKVTNPCGPALAKTPSID